MYIYIRHYTSLASKKKKKNQIKSFRLWRAPGGVEGRGTQTPRGLSAH